MILLIDNYDSFSYNLYQLLGSVEPEIQVVRNDQLTVEDIEIMQPDLIVLSPGPGRPEDAGICVEVVKRLGGRIPIFGVCLGHQAICEAYGAKITYAKKLMHGKTSQIRLNPESTLFEGMNPEITVGRYHSLAADPETLPDRLSVTGQSQDGEIMAVEHVLYPVYGVQFHPESILTPDGRQMIENLLRAVREKRKTA